MNLQPVSTTENRLTLASFYQGIITSESVIENSHEANAWIIDDCYQAKVAASQLVKPCIGAEVLFVFTEKDIYITQILHMPAQAPTQLTSDNGIKISAPVIDLVAYKDLNITALNKVNLYCKQLVQTVADNFVQQAHNMLQQVQNLTLSAKGLLRSHAKQQVITASEDVRVDAKRINMG